MFTLQELVLSNRELGFMMCVCVVHCEVIVIVNRSAKSMMGERFQFSTLSIHMQICRYCFLEPYCQVFNF